MVMLGSVLCGVSLCATQDTQDAPSPDAIGPPTTLADQTARFAAASVAQTSDQPSWIVEQRACEGCPQRTIFYEGHHLYSLDGAREPLPAARTR